MFSFGELVPGSIPFSSVFSVVIARAKPRNTQKGRNKKKDVGWQDLERYLLTTGNFKTD